MLRTILVVIAMMFFVFPAYTKTSTINPYQITAAVIRFVKPNITNKTILVLDDSISLDAIKDAFPDFTISRSSTSFKDTPSLAFVGNEKQAGIARKSLTIGPISCVEGKICAFAVDVREGRITVYYSSAAAAIAGYDIDPNFRLLVREK